VKARLLVMVTPVMLVAACQSAPAPQSVTGCDEATLSSSIEMFLHESDQHLVGVAGLRCSGDWAFVHASLQDGQGAAASEPYIFQRVGDNWVLKAPEIVCGTPSADDSRPVDALVPADLWADACLTA
jgi:hypothetical protein